jgi:hypothetical protein
MKIEACSEQGEDKVTPAMGNSNCCNSCSSSVFVMAARAALDCGAMSQMSSKMNVQGLQADLGQCVFAAHNVEAEGRRKWAASVTAVAVAVAAAADRTQ